MQQLAVRLEQVQVHLFNILDQVRQNQPQHHPPNDLQAQNKQMIDKLAELNAATNESIDRLNRLIDAKTDNWQQIDQSLHEMTAKLHNLEKSQHSQSTAVGLQQKTPMQQKGDEQPSQQPKPPTSATADATSSAVEQQDNRVIFGDDRSSSAEAIKPIESSKLSELEFLEQLNEMARHFRSAYRVYLEQLKHFKISALAKSPNTVGQHPPQPKAIPWNHEVRTQLRSMGQYRFQCSGGFFEKQKSWPNDLQQLQRLQRIRHSVDRKMQRLDKTLQSTFN